MLPVHVPFLQSLPFLSILVLLGLTVLPSHPLFGQSRISLRQYYYQCVVRVSTPPPWFCGNCVRPPGADYLDCYRSPPSTVSYLFENDICYSVDSDNNTRTIVSPTINPDGTFDYGSPAANAVCTAPQQLDLSVADFLIASQPGAFGGELLPGPTSISILPRIVGRSSFDTADTSIKYESNITSPTELGPVSLDLRDSSAQPFPIKIPEEPPFIFPAENPLLHRLFGVEPKPDVFVTGLISVTINYNSRISERTYRNNALTKAVFQIREALTRDEFQRRLYALVFYSLPRDVQAEFEACNAGRAFYGQGGTTDSFFETYGGTTTILSLKDGLTVQSGAGVITGLLGISLEDLTEEAINEFAEDVCNLARSDPN